jgi:hypothetical protein
MSRHGLVRSATLSASPAMVMGPSVHRVALLFAPPAIPGTSYTVSTDPAVALGGGINLVPGGPPVVITKVPFGDAVQKPWYGVASAGLSTIGFLETIEVRSARSKRVERRKGR